MVVWYIQGAAHNSFSEFDCSGVLILVYVSEYHGDVYILTLPGNIKYH